MVVKHNSSQLKIGVIGAGFISQVAHIHSIAKQSDASIVALCDPRSKLAAQVAQEYDVPTVSPSIEALLSDKSIDAVVVCVHRRCLAPIVERALLAGKSVLSEKPMAYSVGQAKRLLSACQAEQVYALGMMKRFDPGVRQFRAEVARVIRGQSLGEIVNVDIADFCPTYGVVPPPHIRSAEPTSFRYEEWPMDTSPSVSEHFADYEYTLNVGSHDINLARWILPDALEPQALFVRSGGTQHAIFSTNSYDVSLRIGRSDSGSWDQSMTIYFEKGRMELHLPSPLDRLGCAQWTIVGPGADQMPLVTAPVSQWSFEAQMAHFCAASRGEVLLENDGDDSLKDIELIEALWMKVVWRQ